VLLIAFDEAGEEDFFLVRLAGSLRVLGIKDVRGTGDEDSLAIRENTGREAEAVHEDGRLVIGAVGFRFSRNLMRPPGLPLPSMPRG